jgi:hypothetical protein
MQAMRALGSSTPHGFAMLATVLGVGLVLYQMTALVLAAPAVNRQIAIALVLPTNTSDELAMPLGYGSRIFLGTLAPVAQPPLQPEAVTSRRTAPVKAALPPRIIQPAPAVVVPNAPTPTDLDGVTATVTAPVVPSQVLPIPIGGGDEEHYSGSRTAVTISTPISGLTQSADD